MLPMVSKELGKAHFNPIMSQTWAVEQVVVTWADCTLRAYLGQRWCTRVGHNMDLIVVDGGAFVLSTIDG